MGDKLIAVGTVLEEGAKLWAPGDSFISVGYRSHIKAGVILNTYSGWIKIGDRVSVGEYSVLYGHGGIEIGDASILGPHCVLAASQHIAGGLVECRFAGETTRGIAIEPNCWIGARVTILDGVRVGTGAIIGAGSVVTSDIPPHWIAYGVPCRTRRSVQRNELYGFEGVTQEQEF